MRKQVIFVVVAVSLNFECLQTLSCVVMFMIIKLIFVLLLKITVQYCIGV